MIKKTDPAIIQSYLEDASNLTGGYADGVYLPENEQEIAAALAECNSKKTPLTVSAGQTGTTGGCIPFGGWVLSTQKLDKIIGLDKDHAFAVVQPGVTLQQIEEAAASAGLLYPPDPTEKSATIGGNIATNASGGRCYRFGSTRNWIRRLKIVLADGMSINIKRGVFFADSKSTFALPHLTLTMPDYKMPATKNSAGYFSAPGMDLVDLFIGAEGTLGVVSEVEIGLIPTLPKSFDLVAFFPSEAEAVNFVLSAKPPTCPPWRDHLSTNQPINFFEFFDANTLQLLRPSYPNIPNNAKAAIYLEAEGEPEEWDKRLAGAVDCWAGEDEKQKQELRKFRHAIPEQINELFKKHGLTKLATDIAVPADKFQEMFNYYNSLLYSRYSSLFYIKFGHIGESHLHVNLLPKNEAEKQAAGEIIRDFIRKAIELGGTVSAEHGIGKIKRDYLKEMYGEKGINEMLRVKKTFDPHFILGRGNIFPA